MFAKIKCAGLLGIEGYLADVETNVASGLPGFSLTGALSPETKEAQFRVWNALKNCGYEPAPRKVTTNLSPSDIRKDGTYWDLPIAVSVLSALEVLPAAAAKKARTMAFFGELGLDGTIKPIRGILPLSFTISQAGISELAVPIDNAPEASLVPGMKIHAMRHLTDVISLLSEDRSSFVFQPSPGFPGDAPAGKGGADFSDIHGQGYLKRAAEIAVSGRHNILFSGPAGTGKTMIATRMPTIMPDLTREEDIELSKMYSICGLLPKGSALLSKRPLRKPHHGISPAAFAGGGPNVMPGEMSLASSGILFLDELPLFPRAVLETMRQPMEERKITVSRMKGSYTYPADFQLVAAMNNCACGFYPDRKKCSCSPAQIRAYNGRLSKPLLERIDICAEASPISYEEFLKKDAGPAESSASIKARVIHVFDIQRERFRDDPGILYNSRMGVREIEKYCVLGKAEEALMKDIYAKRRLSGRTYHKVLKVARTIADMTDCPSIEKEHLLEAVELRSIEDRLFSTAAGGREI